MEPLVAFGAGLVIYCTYLSWIDLRRERQTEPVVRRSKAPAKRPVRARHKPAATPGRGDGAAARWPAPAGGSA